MDRIRANTRRGAFALVRNLVCGFLCCSLSACNSVDTSIRPPAQPASGPGGADYTHAGITAEYRGQGRDAYWLFYPDDPAPQTAPFVVFLHGWGAMQPDVYGAWIEHIVRKGHIVVYPRYQTSLFDTPEQMQSGAAGGVADAWAHLVRTRRVDFLQKEVVWIGHSFGAGLAVSLQPAGLGLPPAGALMLVEPGGRGVDMGGIQQLPPDIRVLIVVGQDDRIAGTSTADEMANQLLQFVPGANLETVTVRSERRSSSPLIADHFAPLAFSRAFASLLDQVNPSSGCLLEGTRRNRRAQYQPDALDFYGFWKLADGLLDWVYRGENLEYAMGDTPQQRFMGTLSNGEPAAPLMVRQNE